MGGKNTMCFRHKSQFPEKRPLHLFNILTVYTNYFCGFIPDDEKIF